MAYWTKQKHSMKIPSHWQFARLQSTQTTLGQKKGSTGCQISLTHSFIASQKQEMCLLGMKTCNNFYSPAEDVKEIAIFKLKLSKISSLHSLLSRPVCFCPQTRKWCRLGKQYNNKFLVCLLYRSEHRVSEKCPYSDVHDLLRNHSGISHNKCFALIEYMCSYGR